MNQIELFSAPSPCVGICENSPKGYCRGCMRSRDERFYWHQMNTGEQLAVMKLCARRYQRVQKRLNQPTEENLSLDFAEEDATQLDLL